MSLPPVYVQSLNFRKMSIPDAIRLLQEYQRTGHMEFATVRLSNKPLKQWKKEHGID